MGITTDADLDIVRLAYARQMLALAGAADNARLEAAFATVRRERFLGSEPWTVATLTGARIPLTKNDPIYAYQDVLFALSTSRGANNGSPSLHARLLNALMPQPGQAAVHIGAGTGYYTALLAELVGPTGSVTAIEVDPVLGALAQENLRDRPNVDVIVSDGAAWPKEEADLIYVNFGVMAPAESWIERLTPAGRLIFPLALPGKPIRPGGPRFSKHGAAFLIERREPGFAASHICPAYFVHGDGSALDMDEGARARLEAAFRSGGAEFVKRLVWRSDGNLERCWFWSPDWSLSYDAV